MAYPYEIVGSVWPGTLDATDNFQPVGEYGPYGVTGDVRYCVALTGAIFAAVFKSTDAGVTWEEQDAGAHPELADRSTRLVALEDGTDLHIVYIAADETLRVSTFSMASDTWTATSSAGPDIVYPSGVESNAIFSAAKRTTDIVVVFNSTSENISSTLYSRISMAVYDFASWSAPSELSGQAGNTTDYGDPVECATGTADRVHVIGGNGAGVLGHVAIETDNSNGAFSTIDNWLTGAVSIGRSILAGTELLVPYLTTSGELTVARATSSAAPTFTLEPTGVIPSWIGSGQRFNLAYGSGFTYLFYQDETVVSYFIYAGGGSWGTARTLYSNTISNVSARIDGGKVVALFSIGLSEASSLWYYEFTAGTVVTAGRALYYSI